jgi:hypothetical protein
MNKTYKVSWLTKSNGEQGVKIEASTKVSAIRKGKSKLGARRIKYEGLHSFHEGL